MTPTLHQAAQQALKALLIELEGYDGPVPHVDAAITALRSALAAPQPEPVAWLYRGGGHEPISTGNYDWRLHMGADAPLIAWRHQEAMPVYAAPPAAPAPVVREPLTDEQINDLFDACVKLHDSDPLWFARAIEQAHGIGGGGKCE